MSWEQHGFTREEARRWREVSLVGTDRLPSWDFADDGSVVHGNGTGTRSASIDAAMRLYSKADQRRMWEPYRFAPATAAAWRAAGASALDAADWSRWGMDVDDYTAYRGIGVRSSWKAAVVWDSAGPGPIPPLRAASRFGSSNRRLGRLGELIAEARRNHAVWRMLAASFEAFDWRLLEREITDEVVLRAADTLPTIERLGGTLEDAQLVFNYRNWDGVRAAALIERLDDRRQLDLLRRWFELVDEIGADLGDIEEMVIDRVPTAWGVADLKGGGLRMVA